MSDTTTRETMPSTASFKKLRDCRSLQEAFETKELRDKIASAVPKHIDADNMLRTFVQATTKTPLILKCDLRQSLGAFMSLSFLGLRPGTVLGHAHMIPFAKSKWNPSTRKREPDGYDLQVIIGYEGYEMLAYSSGFVRDINTRLYLPADSWDEVAGTENYIKHHPNRGVDQSSATPIAVYAIANLTKGGQVSEVMSWAEIMSIRNRSFAYRNALHWKEEAEKQNKRLPASWTEAPWVRDERQMARKTVIRRISHYLPMCPELRAGTAWEEQQEAGKGLDYGPIIDGKISPMDGIPETGDGSGFGGWDDNAGATFTDRREEEETQERAKPTRQRKAAGNQQEQEKRPEPPPPTAPVFEAALIDQWGDIAGDYTDPVKFAMAFADLARKGSGAIGDLEEHNADALADIRANPDALAIITGVSAEEPEPGGDPVPDDAGEGEGEPVGNGAVEFVAIKVPEDRGKPSWAKWLDTLRTELTSLVPDDQLERWCEAQRPTLGNSPMAQRALAVKAIAGQFERARLGMPKWVSELLTAKPAGDADERWVDRTIEELRALPVSAEGRASFDTMVGAVALRAKMANLKRDKPALFDKVDAVFASVDRALPKVAGG